MNRFDDAIKSTGLAMISWTGLLTAWQNVKPIMEMVALLLSIGVSAYALWTWVQTFKLRRLERIMKESEFCRLCRAGNENMAHCPFPMEMRPKDCPSRRKAEN
jgi:hypothetical protein